MARTKGSTNKIPSKDKILDYSVQTIKDVFYYIYKNRSSFDTKQLQELQVLYEKINNILESKSISELNKIKQEIRDLNKDDTFTKSMD